MPWQPGQSGNPEGAGSKGRRFARILERAMIQEESKAEEQQRLRMGIEKALDKAAEGDLPSITFLADRLDGKPAQSVELSGDIGLRKAAEMTDDQLAAIANARG